MSVHDQASCIAFDGHRQIAAGTLADVALATKRAVDGGVDGPVLIFDDVTGRPVELDLRGTPEDILARLPAPALDDESAPRGPGRPKLGVTAREITLLPRHWDWLAAQPGGASATLRRLVEEARKAGPAMAATRTATAYRFMSTMAGDLPGFEEASRALFAADRDRLVGFLASWPADLRHEILRYLDARPD